MPSLTLHLPLSLICRQCAKQAQDRHKEDPSLGSWVDKQRKNFKNGIMDQERKTKLNEIGFVVFTRDKDWNLQFTKLRDYYVKHDHCELVWAVDRFYLHLEYPH
jgi:hypothetical protein